MAEGGRRIGSTGVADKVEEEAYGRVQYQLNTSRKSRARMPGVGGGQS